MTPFDGPPSTPATLLSDCILECSDKVLALFAEKTPTKRELTNLMCEVFGKTLEPEKHIKICPAFKS